MSEDSFLWIVGKAINADAGSWEFQGVFDSKASGIAACRDENYFIGRARLNEVIPDETTPWEKVWYPKLEPEPSDPATENLRQSADNQK